MSEIDDLANEALVEARAEFPSAIRDNCELQRLTRGTEANEYKDTYQTIGTGTVFIDVGPSKDTRLGSKSLGVLERTITMFNFTARPEVKDCIVVPNLRNYFISAINDETGGERFFVVIASADRDRS